MTYFIKIVLILSLLALPIFSAIASEDNSLNNLTLSNSSEVGFLPDSPFYFFKRIFEAIQVILTFDPVKKVQLELKLANRRLLEAQRLVEKDKSELVNKAMSEYEKRMSKANQSLLDAKVKGKEITDVVEQLKEDSLKQQMVLTKVLSQVPPEARFAIEEAQENSLRGLETAIQVVQNQEEVQEFKKNVQERTLKLKKTLEISE